MKFFLFPILIWITCLWTHCYSERIKFAGYKTYRFTAENEEQLDLLTSLLMNNPGVIFLKQPGGLGSKTDIMVPPHQIDILEVLTSSMPSELLMEDVENTMMMHEAEAMRIKALESEGTTTLSFENYWTYEEVMAYLDEVERSNPGLAKVETYGTSSEGRALKTITLSKGLTPANDSKPLAFIDSGNHAREWITVASTCYMINEFTKPNTAANSILDHMDIQIAPVTNPDGYVFSWTTNRMWRKTRTPAPANKPFCTGVDPNRNWSNGFGKSGTSSDPCSDIFPGKSPYSIPETASLHALLMKERPASYTSMHSYSQLFLLSYGCNEVQPDYPDFEKHLAIANIGVEEMEKDGAEYKAGQSNKVLYSACGTSSDSVLAEKLAQFAYTWELKDTGTFGFLLPQTEIVSCATQTTHAWTAMHKEIVNTLLSEK